MRTVMTNNVSEYIALQDLADALETYLPPGREPIAMMQFRQELSAIGECEIHDALNGKKLLDSIHSLGAEMIKASSRWPMGDPLLNAEVAEREEVRKSCTLTVQEQLADYDAQRLMSVLSATAQTNHPGYLAMNRQDAFSSDVPLDDTNYQEAAALIKWDLSEKTQGEVAPPGPRDAFDPIHVKVERRWQSATQLTTAISYDGQELGDFQDNAISHPLGQYVPAMGESDAIKVARNIFYHGHEGLGLKPLNASSLKAMVAQVENDLEVASQSEAMHSLDRLTLSNIPARLERFKRQDPEPSQGFDSPGM